MCVSALCLAHTHMYSQYLVHTYLFSLCCTHTYLFSLCCMSILSCHVTQSYMAWTMSIVYAHLFSVCCTLQSVPNTHCTMSILQWVSWYSWVSCTHKCDNEYLVHTFILSVLYITVKIDMCVQDRILIVIKLITQLITLCVQDRIRTDVHHIFQDNSLSYTSSFKIQHCKTRCNIVRQDATL